MESYRRKIQRTLDSEQKIDARQALGCGIRFAQVAHHFGLTELELRRELDMPQWKTPPTEQQVTLFDDGGEQ